MRRRRCDSPWNKLSDEQQKQMDVWYFEQSLSCREIHERARREFGIDASRQTLTAYFRHREKKRVLAEGGRLTPAEVDELLMQRTGAGMSLEDLEGRTVYSTAMAAYQMSLAEPGSLRVQELRSLMKLLNENRRLVLEQKLRDEKLTLQSMVAASKVVRDQSKLMTKADFEEMVKDTSEIFSRAGLNGGKPRAENESDGEKGTNSQAAGERKRQSSTKEESPKPGGARKESSPV